jgi:hypothetical protein
MKILLRVFWLCVLVSTMVACTSCKKEFKNKQGIAKHQNTCKAIKLNITLLLQKRSDAEELRASERKGAAKIARWAGRDIGEERVSLAKSGQPDGIDANRLPPDNLEVPIFQVRFTI